jgi:hypothetical protein
MEGPPIFMDCNCENGYTTESNLHIQGNSHQNPNVILRRNRAINSKIHLEAQKTLSSQLKEQKRATLEVSQY